MCYLEEKKRRESSGCSFFVDLEIMLFPPPALQKQFLVHQEGREREGKRKEILLKPQSTFAHKTPFFLLLPTSFHFLSGGRKNKKKEAGAMAFEGRSFVIPTGKGRKLRLGRDRSPKPPLLLVNSGLVKAEKNRKKTAAGHRRASAIASLKAGHKKQKQQQSKHSVGERWRLSWP